MSPEGERSEDLKALEAALAALVPRVEGFDRERLIFEAGRASAMAEMVSRPLVRRWAWPTAFSAMTALAATLLVMLVSRPEPQVAQREVGPSAPVTTGVLPAEPATETPAQAVSLAYDHPLRARVLMHGIDLWAEPAVPRSSGLEMARAPSSMLQLQQELMKEWAPGGRAQPRLAPPRFSPFGERS
jgi:hypothetical protein